MPSSALPISARIVESLRLAVSRHVSSIVEARLDRVDHARELSETLLQRRQPWELLADPSEPQVRLRNGGGTRPSLRVLRP